MLRDLLDRVNAALDGVHENDESLPAIPAG
jgi:hypothetical protein